MGVRYLTGEEILAIHFALVDFFATSDDPIAPTGPRDQNLVFQLLRDQRPRFHAKRNIQAQKEKLPRYFIRLLRVIRFITETRERPSLLCWSSSM